MGEAARCVSPRRGMRDPIARLAGCDGTSRPRAHAQTVALCGQHRGSAEDAPHPQPDSRGARATLKVATAHRRRRAKQPTVQQQQQGLQRVDVRQTAGTGPGRSVRRCARAAVANTSIGMAAAGGAAGAAGAAARVLVLQQPQGGADDGEDPGAGGSRGLLLRRMRASVWFVLTRGMGWGPGARARRTIHGQTRRRQRVVACCPRHGRGLLPDGVRGAGAVASLPGMAHAGTPVAGASGRQLGTRRAVCAHARPVRHNRRVEDVEPAAVLAGRAGDGRWAAGASRTLARAA